MRRGFLLGGLLYFFLGLVALYWFSRILLGYINRPTPNIGLKFSFGFVHVGYASSIFGSLIGFGLIVLGTWNLSRARSPKAPADINAMLGNREHVQLYIEQESMHPVLGKKSWALTNLRVIIRHTKSRSLKLTRDYEDITYKDITRSSLQQGLFRSRVICDLRLDPKDTGHNGTDHNKGALVMDHLVNSEARRADGWIRQNITVFEEKYFENPLDPELKKPSPSKLARPN